MPIIDHFLEQVLCNYLFKFFLRNTNDLILHLILLFILKLVYQLMLIIFYCFNYPFPIHNHLIILIFFSIIHFVYSVYCLQIPSLFYISTSSSELLSSFNIFKSSSILEALFILILI